MLKAFQALDHVLNELNIEFKELLICKVLQINCQMHLFITKVSFNLLFLCKYVPERVEVPNKSSQLPIVSKRGRSMAIKQDYSLLAIECFSSKIVNAGQPMVGDTLWVNISYYPVDECHPQI